MRTTFERGGFEIHEEAPAKELNITISPMMRRVYCLMQTTATLFATSHGILMSSLPLEGSNLATALPWPRRMLHVKIVFPTT